jgi:transposase
MTPAQVKEARRQIATALMQPLKPQVRARLVAVDLVLSGKPMAEVAASAQVLPNAVRTWLRVISRSGVDASVARWQVDRRLRPGKLDVEPATLHELAAKEINPRVRKRIRALACVAEGMSSYDAEVKTGLNHWAIIKRVGRFREEGVAAFQDKKIAGRPRKLSTAQFQELPLDVLARPGMGLQQLRDLIWARFRVRYSLTNLRRLLKKEFAMASASRKP